MVHGELDISTRRHLTEVAVLLSDLDRDVDLDLSRVTFIDSSGWDGVTGAVDILRQAGISARVVNGSQPVKRLQSLLAAPILQRAA